jgi:DNA repair photolyase
MTAPILPAINDAEIPALLAAARDAGATSAGYVILRLPWQNKGIFTDWLERNYPDRAARVQSLLKQIHGGELYRSDFKLRQRGTGAVAQTIGDTFKVFATKLGFNEKHVERLSWRSGSWKSPFQRPASSGGLKGQMGLFS